MYVLTSHCMKLPYVKQKSPNILKSTLHSTQYSVESYMEEIHGHANKYMYFGWSESQSTYFY
jgi:hypothetical protein